MLKENKLSNTIMEKYIGSNVEKAKGRLYFNTKAEYGRNEDIIVIWFMKTPKGRFSKFYHVKRWNGTIYKFITDEDLKQGETERNAFTPLSKGYTWSEPYLYSGSYISGGKRIDC